MCICLWCRETHRHWSRNIIIFTIKQATHNANLPKIHSLKSILLAVARIINVCVGRWERGLLGRAVALVINFKERKEKILPHRASYVSLFPADDICPRYMYYTCESWFSSIGSRKDRTTHLSYGPNATCCPQKCFLPHAENQRVNTRYILERTTQTNPYGTHITFFVWRRWSQTAQKKW